MSSQTIDTANHTLPKKNGIKKHTIVYVDDEAHNLSVFKSLFRKLYDVILFVNPIEALDYLRKHDVSILITDQQMPEMKGTELIESITKEKGDLITIILTGYSDVKVIKDAINRCNINCFITKPFDFDEMEAELDSQILVLELKKEKEDLIKQIQSNNFQLESEVSKRKEELAATNERLFEGLRYAKKIQKSILSDRRILKDVFSDVMIFYKPLDIVSGDFYFFKRIGNKVIIAAFDCTGHGVPGAILSMLGSSTLDNLVTGQVSRPSQLLIAVNNKLHEVLNSEGETNDGMDGCILLYNLDTQKLSYCGANSSMIYFINGERIRVRGNRLSLGDNYIAEDQNVNQENFDAREISSIYLFSDGFKDQINASCTEKFNTKRFNDLLSQIHTEDFENQKEMLGDELSRWRGSTHQVDDIMILGFKMFAQ